MKLAFLLLLAGCGSSNHTNQDLESAPEDLSISCSHECNCDHGEVCAGSSSAFAYEGTCLPTCDVHSPCSGGAKCVKLFDDPTIIGPVCITTSTPAACPNPVTESWHCDTEVAHCVDDTTLFQPYSDPTRGLCGTEVVQCSGMCVGLTSDGGAQGQCT